MGVIAPLQPGLFLAVLLGSFYGAVAHLLFGRHWLRLPFFILAGVGGCIFVWLIGVRIMPRFPAPGGLPLLESSVMAWLLLLLIAAWRRA